jgi:hypothetical protein
MTLRLNRSGAVVSDVVSFSLFFTEMQFAKKHMQNRERRIADFDFVDFVM